MVEAYVEGEWILLDGNGRYSDDYDPTNPYIIRDDNDNPNIWEGFVLGKGLDPWDLGFLSEDDYREMSTDFINDMNTGKLDEYFDNPGTYEMRSNQTSFIFRTDNLICEKQIGSKMRHLYRSGMKKDKRNC